MSNHRSAWKLEREKVKILYKIISDDAVFVLRIANADLWTRIKYLFAPKRTLTAIKVRKSKSARKPWAPK